MYSDSFGGPFVVKGDLEELVSQKFPSNMFTDSKSLFIISINNSTTVRKRLNDLLTGFLETVVIYLKYLQSYL